MDTAPSPTTLIAAAYRIADDLLFPDAAEVDRTGEVPATHWTALADAGLYGIAAPQAVGGPGLELTQVIEIIEVLTSGCLSTAFTWLQHHGVVISLAGTTSDALRDELLDAAVSGRTRAGVAYAGAVPTPPRMSASRTDGGWVFSGYAPFVSGWGHIDLLQISARDVDSDDVIAAIVPTHPMSAAITVSPMRLTAGNASHTVSLRVDSLPVPDALVVSRVALDDFFATQNIGIRLNGALPFGILRRCTALLDRGGATAQARRLRERGSEIRTRLDTSLADADALLAARADGAQLAVDAAAALVAADGGRALVVGSDADRLSREATFTLVAASRPELKGLLLQRFSGESE